MTLPTGSAASAWQTAFPLKPTADAVSAICESWRILTERPRRGFHIGLREPVLTRALKTHVETVTARERGLLGMWAAESVINIIDPETAEITTERRTDIVYGWNDDTQRVEFVFEFKKLNRYASSRKHYLGEKGLQRFVTGIYAQGQLAAAMVGMLLDSSDKIVPKLEADIGKEPYLTNLMISKGADGMLIEKPSQMFAVADFDTSHIRPLDDTLIRVAHIFLTFD